MRLADVAGEGEHEGESVFRGGDGVAARRVHDHDAVVGGGGAVDVIHADAGAADGFEIFCGSEDFRGDLGFRTDHEAVVVADDFEEFVRLEAGDDVHGDFRG